MMPALFKFDAQALESLCRNAFVLACVGLAAWLWVLSPLPVRDKKAAVAAGIVHFFLSALIDLFSVHHGVYRCVLTRHMLWGVAFDIHLGWAALWGTGLCLAWLRFRPALQPIFFGVVIALTLALDFAALNSGRVFVALRPDWWLWDLGALLFLASFTLIFFRIIRENRLLIFRAALYALIYTAVFYVMLPALVFEFGERKTFDPVTLLKPWHWVAFGIVSLPGAGATSQFSLSGNGTPLPLDPPRHLVTNGIYAFVRNPMQLSGLLAAVIWAVATGSFYMWIYVLDLLLLFLAVKFFEERELTERFGDDYIRYAQKVRKWLPRFAAHSPK